MYGGISLALHKMTDIVEVNSSDFDATVRAGTVYLIVSQGVLRLEDPDSGLQKDRENTKLSRLFFVEMLFWCR